MVYTAKKCTIINYTLTDANTWYKVASTVAGIRKWKMKARESTDNSFDYAFDNSSPSTYMTNGGQGVSFDGCDLPDVYARSATAGTVIEIEYWS